MWKQVVQSSIIYHMHTWYEIQLYMIPNNNAQTIGPQLWRCLYSHTQLWWTGPQKVQFIRPQPHRYMLNSVESSTKEPFQGMEVLTHHRPSYHPGSSCVLGTAIVNNTSMLWILHLLSRGSSRGTTVSLRVRGKITTCWGASRLNLMTHSS